MNDSYVELLVKRRNSLAAMIGRNILIGVGTLSLILTVLSGMNFILFIITALIYGFAYVCHMQIYTEYEYLCLAKTFSVDKISNRSRRKKLAEYGLENMEILAPASSHRLDQYNGRGDIKTVDYTSKTEGAPVYAMVIKNGNVLTRLLIEMNEEMLKQLRMTSPRKVFED
ncbi:MAG: hypothetical protein J5842_07315 [Lachnospiraceae bacterium]|nr:hypothetical protein [Lachnospiraceae bacterium]